MKKEKTIKDENLRRGVSTLDFAAKNSKPLFLLLALMIIFSRFVYAGHSILDRVDPTFNPQISTSSFSTKEVSAIEILPDGKILAAGKFNSYNRQPVGGLIRLNADASLDTTFNNNVVPTNLSIRGMILQPDGKIILYGIGMMRLNSDGTLDPTFNYAEGGGVSDAALDAGGRIILGGNFPSGKQVIRLHPNGALDSSFNFTPTETFGHSAAVATQNNKVIVTLFGSSTPVRRLNEDGSVDSTFTPLENNYGNEKLIVQPDNKILYLNPAYLQRLNENGGIDNSFRRRDFLPAFSSTMRLASDGRLTVVTTNTGVATIRRFLSSGEIDLSFTPHSPQRFKSFALQPDGSVIIGDSYLGGSGFSGTNDFARLFPNGMRDASFNSGGNGFQTTNPGSVWAIGMQTDGKILIGGKFNEVNNLARQNIARLNADATVDASFQINTSGTGNYFSQINNIYNIAQQPDGKLLVTGGFTYFLNGVLKATMARLNADGSIDPTFNPSIVIPETFGSSNGGKNRFVILNDGRILVGASRFSSTGVAVPIKLNSNGVYDNTFSPTIFSGSNPVYIMDVAVQPDGKILIGGRHATGGSPTSPSVTKSFIARLNADGSVDQTFQITEETDKEISGLKLLPDGKIVIAKMDSPLTARQPTKLFRLNSNGSADSSFNTGTGVNGNVNALLRLSSGKIMVGGKFTTFNGQPRGNLALINADGSLDAMLFNVNQEVVSLAVDNDGRVLVGGDFTSISVDGGQNNSRTYIARLIDSSVSGRTRFDFDGDGIADLGVFNESSGNWAIRHSLANQTFNTQFGQANDRIAPADYDDDGKADIAVYRAGQGIWYLLRSAAGFAAVRWGAAEDKPVPADYDGDGKADVAVWRPSNGTWYILRSGATAVSYQFGTAGDVPVPADYDGDGKTDVAVWRPSNGTFYWLASGSNNLFKGVQFGQTGDIPAVADYNGDRRADLVVFRPSNGVWYQYLTVPVTIQSGVYTFKAIQFGQTGDEPVAADYDGDGKTDAAVRRQGMWHILKSGQGYSSASFGNENAQAVAGFPNQ